MSRLAKPAIALAAAATTVLVAPGTALGFHTDITGVASCLAADGSYSVTWSVLVPDEWWSQGYTATLSSSIALSPGGALSPGQVATGVGTGYTGATATLSVTSSWTSGNVETNDGTVARPTTPCVVPTTTAPATTAPATTAAPTTTTAAPVATVAPTTTAAAVTPVVASTTTTVAPAVGSSGLSGSASSAKLPATGSRDHEVEWALIVLLVGALAVLGTRRVLDPSRRS
ncbi:MAG: hypothetical protein U0Q03_18845 [Acidimicrobiales bacterium]